MPPTWEQVADRVVMGPNNCWVWTGARSRGYGRVQRQGRIYPTHRFSYEVHHGPIPAGMWVCHRCDNPPCCNPDHLFVHTPAGNFRDRDRKGRGVVPRTTKLSFEDVLEIRAALDDGATQRAVAARFGISQSQVSNISTRRQRETL